MSKEVNTKRIAKTPPKRRSVPKEKDSFTKLRSLDCFNELDAKIKAGVAVEEVARWLQKDMFQMTDIQLDSLKRQLYRYKASLPPAELLKATEEPLYVRQAVEKLERGFNELEELEKLYLLQLKRISTDAQTENKINKLFKGTNKEIELASNLLEKILKLKMELGILEKSPDRLEVGGLVGHMPVMPDQLKDDKSADKTMTRMGLIASKLFKAVEEISSEDEENVIDVDCEEVQH